MSKIKNALTDIYGEDWSNRLADIVAKKGAQSWLKKN